jgi:hypothetical protein
MVRWLLAIVLCMAAPVLAQAAWPSRPVRQDLIAGRLQFFVGPLVNTMPLAQGGQIRVIGVANTGAGPVSSTPAECARVMAETVAQCGPVIRAHDIPLD